MVLKTWYVSQPELYQEIESHWKDSDRNNGRNVGGANDVAALGVTEPAGRGASEGRGRKQAGLASDAFSERSIPKVKLLSRQGEQLGNRVFQGERGVGGNGSLACMAGESTRPGWHLIYRE